MNIKEAKDQVKNAMTAYFAKDEHGNYRISVEKQRPVFLMGPPGIGKTAIMEQIAAEMGVGLMSYSMTHHTRQSVLGLPFIVHKNYDGREYDVSEYTMSEIISSVYEMMENTGTREGILFLDEINCVSETLAPIMLQFLQYKVLGRHKVPDGWIVVAAGNPPEYNHSVRDFDVVTWDRLKRIDIEPDFGAWKEYAYQTGVHSAVITYLEIMKNDFYKLELEGRDKNFVTARGWDDLSQMLHLYDEMGIDVDEKLIAQYLQNRRIAKDFADYYTLYRNYSSDYEISGILKGAYSGNLMERYRATSMNERISLMGLMIDAITVDMRDAMEEDRMLAELRETVSGYLKRVEQVTFAGGCKRKDRNMEGENTGEFVQNAGACEGKSIGNLYQEEIRKLLEERKKLRRSGARAGSLSKLQQARMLLIEDFWEDEMQYITEEMDAAAVDALIRGDYNSRVRALGMQTEKAGVRISNLFRFCNEAFPGGEEMQILITELTVNNHTAQYISRFGCDDYFKHNNGMLMFEKKQKLMEDIDGLYNA